MDIKSLFGVSGKRVLITGGGRGIGLYMAQGFVANGGIVYIASRSAESCSKIAEKLTSQGPGKCIALESVDLTKPVDACEKLAKNLEKLGVTKLDVLINNAGVTWGEDIASHKEIGWDKVYNVNVKGLFWVTKTLLPLLQKDATKENPSRIINVGSIAGFKPQRLQTYAYDSSKAAVHHLTTKLAADLAPTITVNAIAPGFVHTKMGDQILTFVDKGTLESMLPLNRLLEPEDMAGVAIYLASRAGSGITGETIVVDCGALASKI